MTYEEFECDYFQWRLTGWNKGDHRIWERQ